MVKNIELKVNILNESIGLWKYILDHEIISNSRENQDKVEKAITTLTDIKEAYERLLQRTADEKDA